jgi:membrane associated rhomboid family serine protease
MTQVPQPVVPVCYRHPKRETYVRCTRCDRPICPDCMNEASVGHQCPECVAEGRRTQRPTRTAFGASLAGTRGYVTITLIALNVFMMILAAASARGGNSLFGGSGFGGLLGGITPLHLWGALVPGPTTFVDVQNGAVVGVAATTEGVAGGEYYRMLTNMFLHYGLLHLLLNMWALWVLGRTLEAVLGPVRFLALYLASGLGGSVAVFLFANPHSASAGASGAIFGLFAALFIVLKRLGRDTSSVIPILIINIAISFVPGISLAAHFGGLVTGGIVAAAMAYAPSKARTQVQAAVVVAVLMLIVLLTVVGTGVLANTPNVPVGV